ncbi:MAG: DUF2505 family protein [Myxococcales bacterium]|nr:DUF2505 family protein [Myxococcales bacterium]
MASTRIEHTFDCDEPTFWRVLFFDADFNRKLFMEHLRFDGWDVERYEDRGDAIDRTIVVKPVTGALPAPLKKLAGDNLGYREKGRFDKKTGRYRFEVIPNTLPDKLSITGEIHLEPRDGKIRRILDLQVKASVFGVGGLVEKRIIEDTQKSYDASYGYMQQHLASQPG